MSMRRRAWSGKLPDGLLARLCVRDRGCLRGAVVEPVRGEGMRETGTYETVQVGDVEEVPPRIGQLDGIGAAVRALHANLHGGPPVGNTGRTTKPPTGVSALKSVNLERPE